MLNGIVGYQLLDDGTPMSMGLIFASSAVLFVGTGYIALDTGFSWTGYWDSSLTDPNQAYALYTLYQLVPLVFLVVFFLLEAFLVLRILGEKKPMRMLCAPYISIPLLIKIKSVPHRRRPPLRNRPNFPIHRQRSHLQRDRRQDQRRHVRNALHLTRRRHHLGVLVKYNGGRLANARRDGLGDVHIVKQV
jgi:hypothetical protein